MLNKAVAAVEEENDALAGVLKNNIDFNEVKGKTKIPDKSWKDLLDHFNQPKFVLVIDTLSFPEEELRELKASHAEIMEEDV